MTGNLPNDEAVSRLVGASMPETNDQSASTASGPKTLARATDNPNLGLPVLASRSASHVAQGWRPDRHLPGHDRQELADKALLTIEQG